jgi:hypothetical protein
MSEQGFITVTQDKYLLIHRKAIMCFLYWNTVKTPQSDENSA